MSAKYHKICLGGKSKPKKTPETVKSISVRRQTASADGTFEEHDSTVADILFGPKEKMTTFEPEVVIVEGDDRDDDRIRVLNTLDKPFRYICALDLYFPNYNQGYPLAGSGALIGPNVVLTCAHNLHAHNLKKTVNRVTVAPAQASLNSKPFGDIEVVKAFLPEEFMASSESDVNYDYAALILAEPIGEKTGYFGIVDTILSDLENHKIHLTGYPALPNVEFETGKGMMHDAALFKGLDDGVLKHGTDSSGGNSGSPLYIYEHNSPNVKPLVVGVHSGGPIGGQYNHGACLMGSVYDHFNEWIEEGRKYLESQSSA